ncbi:MAG: hypothetical protein AABX39_06310 [Nanoarchaeota archaeon]
MDTEELIRKLEGLHTIETVMQELSVKRQTALNTLSMLKRQQYCTVSGGGKQPRTYKITMTKQLPRSQGMFDILNKYNPKFKLSPWYDHQVHGSYGVEDAIVDAIQTRSFRAILATLRLFNQIKNWKKLYHLAKEKKCWNKVGALYEAAKKFLRVRTPSKFPPPSKNSWETFTQLKKKNFFEVSQKWRVFIPFNEKDVQEVL